jgi:hypothetical protein
MNCWPLMGQDIPAVVPYSKYNECIAIVNRLIQKKAAPWDSSSIITFILLYDKATTTEWYKSSLQAILNNPNNIVGYSDCF